MRALLFGLGQPQACYWVGLLTPLLHSALGHEKQLPARRPADLERVLSECPELRELLIEGTEGPIRRPQDKGRRRKGLQRQGRSATQVVNTDVGSGC